MSGTGQLVWELDAIQYGLGEGPWARATCSARSTGWVNGTMCAPAAVRPAHRLIAQPRQHGPSRASDAIVAPPHHHVRAPDAGEGGQDVAVPRRIHRAQHRPQAGTPALAHHGGNLAGILVARVKQ